MIFSLSIISALLVKTAVAIKAVFVGHAIVHGVAATTAAHGVAAATAAHGVAATTAAHGVAAATAHGVAATTAAHGVATVTHAVTAHGAHAVTAHGAHAVTAHGAHAVTAHGATHITSIVIERILLLSSLSFGVVGGVVGCIVFAYFYCIATENEYQEAAESGLENLLTILQFSENQEIAANLEHQQLLYASILEKIINNFKKIIEQILRYLKINRNEICSICQDPIYNSSTEVDLSIWRQLGGRLQSRDISKLPIVTPCKHTFHYSCIKNWKITCDRYRREFTCPSCRNTLPSVNQIIIDIIKDIQNIPKTATIQIQKIWRDYKVRKNLES